jgi:hypothetical protein
LVLIGRLFTEANLVRVGRVRKQFIELTRSSIPKGSRFIGSNWVTQPFLLTRAILAKVELKQAVERIRHLVVLKGLLGFLPSGD